MHPYAPSSPITTWPKKKPDFLLPPTKSPGLLTQKTQQKHLEPKEWVLLFFKADRTPEAEANQKNPQTWTTTRTSHWHWWLSWPRWNLQTTSTRRGRLDREMPKTRRKNGCFQWVFAVFVLFIFFFWGGEGWKSHLKWNVRRSWISMERVRKIVMPPYLIHLMWSIEVTIQQPSKILKEHIAWHHHSSPRSTYTPCLGIESQLHLMDGTSSW